MTAPDEDWDPLAPDALRDPWATYAALRRRCPVAYTRRIGGVWALTTHADIVQAARAFGTFGSAATAKGNMRLIPLESDPPEHTLFRQFLQPYFTPAYLECLAPTIQRLAATMLDAYLALGRGDFVSEVAYPLPLRVLCAFLNQPDEDWLAIKQTSEAMYRSDPRFSSTETGDHPATEPEALYAYARRVVNARRAAPLKAGHDLISGLLALRRDGQPIPDEIIISVLRLILSAGHNSTTTALSIAVLFLATNPDAQALLRAEPRRLPGAIEEILRHDSPVQFVPRVLMRDKDVRGRQLRAGEKVILVWASGNRDEEAFPDAHRCKLDRETSRSLVFGHGLHKCLGVSLARLELRVVLEELLRRTTHFHVAGDAIRSRWPRLGVTTLPLLIER